MKTTNCTENNQPPQGADILFPDIKYFKPAPIVKDYQKGLLRQVCPFFDPDSPLCCNDDQAEILCK